MKIVLQIHALGRFETKDEIRNFAVVIMSWKETPDIAAALDWTLL